VRTGATLRALANLATLATLVAACSGLPDAPTEQSDASLSRPETSNPVADAVPSFPLTLNNCGSTVRLDRPPTRVVALKSTPVETMLALGLGDLIVGTAYLDGPIPDELAAEGLPIPIAQPMADKLPGLETVLALEPDLIYAGWESMVSAEGIAARDRLADLGIATYVSPSACRDPGWQPDPLTFDTVFAEFTEVGTMFQVEQEAEALIEANRADLAAAVPLTGERTVLWWSSATDIPYVGAGIGAPQLIASTAGLVNVAGGVRDTWTSLGWEEIVAADPWLFVLVDAEWNTAAHKIETLRTMPATRQLQAVREQRFAILPFAATQGGPRTAWAVNEVVRQAKAVGAQ
jgi:iron complex transport system substrate-binding protein